MRKEILQKTSLFCDLKNDKLEELARFASAVTVKSGGNINLDDFDKNYLFVMAKGKAGVFTAAGGNSENASAYLIQYDVFGEISLISDCPQSGIIEAVEDCEILRLQCSDVKASLNESPEFSSRLLKTLSKYFQKNGFTGNRPVSGNVFEKVDDCWKHIGVLSDTTPTCAKLKEVVHCRNCEVFAEAGKTLFTSGHPAGYLDEWTSDLAKEKKAVSRSALSAFIFRLGAEWLALPAGIVNEVVEKLVIRSIPFKNKALLLGMVNIRGEIQLCVSLNHLLALEGNADEEDNQKQNRVVFGRMVFIGEKDAKWAFPVDEVYGIYKFGEDELKKSPVTASKSAINYSTGVFSWENKNVGYLDGELLLFNLSRGIF